MPERQRKKGTDILRSVISEKAFILSSYLYFMSCKSSSNMCVVPVFELQAD